MVCMCDTTTLLQDAQTVQPSNPPKLGASRRTLTQAMPQRVKALNVPLRYVEGLNDARTKLAAVSAFCRSLFDITVRDEAKEVRPDARPQVRKNRRCIRWNTLRIFSSRERLRWSQIVRRSRKVNVGQAPMAVPEVLQRATRYVPLVIGDLATSHSLS